MGKRILLIALAAVMLAGCGILENSGASTTMPTTAPTTAATVSTTVTTAPTRVTSTVTTTAAPSPTVPTTMPVLEGWQEQGGSRYYYDGGQPVTGWQEIEGMTYYFREDGRMARGKVVFSDTETRYFTAAGEEILLVNPWNLMPKGYTVTLKDVTATRSVAEICYEPLLQMIADCESAIGEKIIVRSAYRSNSDQVYLYERKIQRLMDTGMSRAVAEVEAAKVVAIPGTSEHQLGLAVDLAGKNYQTLDEKQEQTAVQQWFMEHCWEYGFILRYPNNKSAVTGIVYEPWHYRYVGVELAMELRDSGLCLEEYLEQLH